MVNSRKKAVTKAKKAKNLPGGRPANSTTNKAKSQTKKKNDVGENIPALTKSVPRPRVRPAYCGATSAKSTCDVASAVASSSKNPDAATENLETITQIPGDNLNMQAAVPAANLEVLLGPTLDASNQDLERSTIEDVDWNRNADLGDEYGIQYNEDFDLEEAYKILKESGDDDDEDQDDDDDNNNNNDDDDEVGNMASLLQDLSEHTLIVVADTLIWAFIGVVDVDEDDNEVFQIPIQVPVCSAMDTIEVPSTISWSRFWVKLSNKMDIPESKLDVAYKLSFEPKADLPNCLSTAKHLLQMICIASRHLSGEVKTHLRKPFAVVIVDKTPKDIKKGTSSKATKVSSRQLHWLLKSGQG